MGSNERPKPKNQNMGDTEIGKILVSDEPIPIQKQPVFVGILKAEIFVLLKVSNTVLNLKLY